MARNIKQDACDKVVGGQTVPQGQYFIVESDITVEPLKIRGQADSEFDAWNVRVAPNNNGAQGPTLDTSIRLNGFWRERVDKDGKVRKPYGDFFDLLLSQCQGKSFDAGRDYINNNLKQRRISVAYDTYVSHTGQIGHIMKISFVQ
jgi:hypothetical protein